MKRRVWLLAVALMASPLANAADAVEGLAVLSELGQANGVALACHQSDTAKHIKQLVIELAPRSRAWGAQFEEGTNQGFLDQHQPGAECPAADVLAARVNDIETRLRSALGAS